MAISRSLMNRQLRADGGIMQVAPREKFGLGSKLKKFVRKIIPNEVSEIAVKAAPFVAPFNPLLAAGMAGIGGFDQTGRIGSSLKSGALTYGMGQGARYLGGADFQGLQNPFSKGAFSMPTGSGGIKNLFKDNTTQAIQPISGNEMGSQFTEPTFGAGDAIGGEMMTTGAGTVADTATQTLANPGSAMDSFKSIVSFDTPVGDKGKAALDLLKRGSKTLFYDKNGDLDKAAVIGAATAAASYAEALMLARNAGVELTEEEYDQAQRDEKQEEYGVYLQNFFGGKKDGGRIGFESGANGIMGNILKEELMPELDGEDFVIIMTEDGPVKVRKTDIEEMPGMFRDTTTGEGSNMFRRIEEANGGRIGLKGGGTDKMEQYKKYVSDMIKDGETPIDFEEFLEMTNYKDGGRINYARGSKPKDAEIGIMSIDVEAGDDEDEEDMDMAMAFPTTVFSSSEISRLFRDRSLSTNLDRKRLYKVIMNPGMFPDGEKMLIRNLRGKADGGRIGFESGANEMIKKKLMMELGLYPSPEEESSGIGLYPSPITEEEGSEIIMTKDGPVSVKEIFERDTPLSEDLLGMSDGFTLSPVTLLRRYLANKELENKADGGRIGYKGGANRVSELLILRDNLLANGEDVSDIEAEIFQLTGKTFKSVGGISNIPTGNMRKNNAGVVERDYRDEGGFVPVGIKERADDVPAMLSKNEFVMTADAVRGIGNGSVEEGSKKLYNTMKKAEQVGKA